ncbi:kinase-like protein [Anaeromyces robustus]|uniref:non-specific serine/threonine protein kinase n=1 Tax=Anaeromyces robustus TaxID=1754192 RepID=A0A1Y1WZW0_9FUNG|nr:kinase-like protein [Anaeromyces robustus]|eukprot:ORX79090.1 kinase-like protein [Anaeromyces robustus]
MDIKNQNINELRDISSISIYPNPEHIDLSNKHDSERIVEISPNRRYAKLNCILGKGAYKTVYKALDWEEGFEVAWSSTQTSKAEYIELNEEIEILKRVRHPNIINFHDCWYNNNEIIFITELMTSGTLREYIRKLQVPYLKIIKRWSRQILKGLYYLHSYNPPIIHRDIKCDNIFINGAHGEVKIGDMGTAKMKLGKNYTVIGTPEFMAPEMYEEKGYNEKVDVYAFGMCLLEMVTGEYPYSECKNPPQVYKKVINGTKPECLSRVNDPQVLEIINSCICPENERWTVKQLLETSFFLAEPEVLLLSSNETKNHLTMQVIFKGADQLSVKFEFNTDTDTAEDVVSEMIQEEVIPEKYQQLITSEINGILREMNKYTPELDENKEEDHHIWKRGNAISKKIEQANQRFKDAERRIMAAEEAIKKIDIELENIAKKKQATLEYELQKKAVISDGTIRTPQEMLDDGK